MKIFKIVNSNYLKQSGFSLMEMMIGGALLVGASLAAIKMFSDQKNAQRRIAMDRALDSHVGMLKMSLATRASCNSTFGTANVIDCSVVKGPAFTDACASAVNNIATMYSLYSNFPTTLGSIQGASGPIISVGGKINNENTHTLSAIRVTPPDSGESGLARIELDYNIVAFNQLVTRSIFVPIRIFAPMASKSGTSIYYECSDDQLGVEKTLQKEGCEAMGVFGSYDEGTQECASGNLKYDSTGLQVKCDAGQDIVGILPNGEVTCATVNSRFQPTSNTVAPAATNCNGKQVRFRVMPGNKVGVECI